MTLLATPQSSIEIRYNSNTLIFEATDLDIERPITEGVASAYFKADYPHETTVPLGASIDIWLGRDSLNKVFTGRIDSFRKIIEGHNPRWIEGTGSGYGNVLNYSYCIDYRTTLATAILSDLVQPLIDNGKLSGKTIVPSTKTFKANWQDRTRSEAIRDVCDQIGYDWYVDLGGTFRAFPIGYNTNPNTIDNKILTFGYKEDIERVINSQICIGALEHTIGTDDPLTEQLSVESGDLKGSWSGPNIALNTTDKTIGTYCISVGTNDCTGVNSLYLKRTFGNTLDLTYGGQLVFYIKHKQDRTWTQSPIDYDYLNLNIYFKTNSNWYRFNYQTKKGGQFIYPLTEDYPYGERWFDTPWIKIICPFNLQSAEVSGWDTVGSPDWSKITDIEIYLAGPLGTPMSSPWGNTDVRGSLYLDGMTILRRAYGKAQNSTSIGKYDERRGKIIIDSGLKTDAACQALATSIVDAYDDPLPTIDEVVTYGDFSWKEGDEVTVTARENTITAIVRNIHHELRNFDLHTTYELSPRYIPEIETIIGDLITKTEELERFKIYTDEGVDPRDISPMYTKPMGEDVIEIAPDPNNLIYNPGFEIDSNYDDIPDGWWRTGIDVGRSDQDSHSGLWSGSVTTTKWLASKLVPAKPDMEYIASGWIKGAQGKMTIRFTNSWGSGIGTFDVCDYVTESDWSFKTASTISPSDTRYVSFTCVANCGAGEYVLFDDVRLVAIPPPEEVPKDAPEGNLLPNGQFTYDWDGDGIADHWNFKTIAGTPEYGRTNIPKFGGWSTYIYCTTTESGEFCSDLVNVGGGREYQAISWMKTSAAITTGITFGVRYYDISMNPAGTFIVYSGGEDTDWSSRSKSSVCPNDARYAEVFLAFGNPNISSTIYWDDVRFYRPVAIGVLTYVDDDWTVSTKDLDGIDVKKFTIFKSPNPSDGIDFKRLYFQCKFWNTEAGHGSYVKITRNSDTIASWTITETEPTLKKTNVDTTGWSEGEHTIALNLSTDDLTYYCKNSKYFVQYQV